MNEDVRAIEHLRHLRQRRPPTSIEQIVKGVQKAAEQSHRRLGNVVDVWEAVVPADLVSRTRVMSLRGGTLHVAVLDSAVAFEVDRALRSGLEAAIRQSTRSTLVRIKLRVSRREVLGEDAAS